MNPRLLALVVVLRISASGRSTKLNAFDLVVTVASAPPWRRSCSKTVPLAEGIAALTLLVGLQFSSRLSVRWPSFRRLVKSEPTLLMLRGSPLDRRCASSGSRWRR
ncbi:MAG: hypothetical protein R3D28_15575 [Geminicoccaceae bacterium]